MSNEFNVQVGRYRTRVLIEGSGKPVILLHGLGGSIESWKSNLKPLASKFKVYAFDMLGFGMADKPRIQYKVDVFTDFLQNFMDVMGLRKASLIGSSLGGLIAAWFSVHNQSRVEKLVLENAAGLEVGARNVIASFMGEWWTLENLKRFYQFVYYDSSKINGEILRFRLEMFSSEDAKYAYRSTLNMPREWETLPVKLKKLEKPTLIIWGAQDKLIPVECAHKFHSLIKNSRLLILEETGHVPHAEKPEEFNQAVIGFLLDC
jgi:pimeloyl-ACP methyl ester carboxylesterase